MYARILVPVDFSVENLKCLNHIKKVIDEESKVTLLHVIEEIGELDEEEDRVFLEKLENRAKARMINLAETFEQQGLHVETCILTGKRVLSILQYANEKNISLIVLSSHVPDMESPRGRFGSISHSIAAFSPCPVTLIK